MSENYANVAPRDWSRLPGNRIAVVTQDAHLDARIRSLFANQKQIESLARRIRSTNKFVDVPSPFGAFEILTVPDFLSHQEELVPTKLSIIDATASDARKKLWQIRELPFWEDYPLIALLTREQIEELSRFVGGFSEPYDMCLQIDSDLIDIVHFAMRITSPLRAEWESESYRI